MKKLGTYIGICDFMSQQEVFAMLDAFKNYKHYGIKLMIGTMTSFKVLNKQETKWTDIFPKVEALKYIFSAKSDYAINCIHYADYGKNPGLAETLRQVVVYCGPGLDAIQLDMIWPDPKELEKFQGFHQIPIVLQVSQKSMEQCDNNPVVVAEKIRREYGGLISHVLFDCSMGKGIPIDVSNIVQYIEAMKSYTSGIDIAVAGGLGPGTVYDVEQLIKQYGVSIDAQSKLRTSGNNEDPIDWDLAKQYVNDAMACYL